MQFTEPVTHCPLCDAKQLRDFVQLPPYAFSRCAACTFVFLNPMPTQEALNAVYQAETSIHSGHYPKAASRRRRALLRAWKLRRWYKGVSALDLGCGGGFMVDAFRRLGAARVCGIDVDAGATGYAEKRFPNCRFLTASYEQLLQPSVSGEIDKFDFIYCSEVIEHINDVGIFMAVLQNLSRENAYLYITTPDIAASGVPADVRDWEMFTPPKHVQFFQQNTLTALMAKYGFSPLRRDPDRKTGLKMLFQRKG